MLIDLLTVMCFLLLQNYRAEQWYITSDSVQFSSMSPLIPFLLQSVTQKKRGLSVQTFYNLSKEQLKVSGNINMDQQLGCGIRNPLDNQLSGSHCIKLSSFPIWHYCGISTSDHGHTIFSLLPDGLWPGLRYSFDSKTVKLKPAGDKWCTFQRLCCTLRECDVAVRLWDPRNIIMSSERVRHFKKNPSRFFIFKVEWTAAKRSYPDDKYYIVLFLVSITNHICVYEWQQLLLS